MVSPIPKTLALLVGTGSPPAFLVTPAQPATNNIRTTHPRTVIHWVAFCDRFVFCILKSLISLILLFDFSRLSAVGGGDICTAGFRCRNLILITGIIIITVIIATIVIIALV